jgi:hypothetical protein
MLLQKKEKSKKSKKVKKVKSKKITNLLSFSPILTKMLFFGLLVKKVWKNV